MNPIIEENVSLRSYNSFGLNVMARYFTTIHTEEQMCQLVSSSLYKSQRILLLGGGSNILFSNDFDGLVIKCATKGIHILEENERSIQILVAAGEIWDQVVDYCVQNHWGGIENLSLIPGTMGAAPVQNIGAYGTELQTALIYVKGTDMKTGDPFLFSHAQCNFGYRSSCFKSDSKKNLYISHVALKLSKHNHTLHIHYDPIRKRLSEKKITNPSLGDIRKIIIATRREKLPDPNHIGNAGSFFQNPTVPKKTFIEIQKEFPSLKKYHFDRDTVKIPAAQLIELCGWKGKKIKNVGVHTQHALVLVNYGNGTGEEILELMKHIQVSVQKKFKIDLLPEVTIV